MSAFIGSPEHKELLCRFLIDSHDPYVPAELPWPELDEPVRERLASLPIWDEALKIESNTALIVNTMGETVKDPMLGEAIRLQGFEEARHAQLIGMLTDRYRIPVKPVSLRPPPRPEWAFMRIGYGECFDSFFAFGLFALARDSGLMQPELVRLFEPVMQEEGRHIIFHVNWVAYTQAQMRFALRPSYVFRRALAIWMQLLSRIKTVLRVKRNADRSERNFTLKAHSVFSRVAPADFVTLCMTENERRLSRYDPRLLRPAFVPTVARAALRTLIPSAGRREAGRPAKPRP
jgi:hypothetical protein